MTQQPTGTINALGSKPVNVDTGKLRSWLETRLEKAHAKMQVDITKAAALIEFRAYRDTLDAIMSGELAGEGQAL